jgi:regulator of protease activity HflC (stomatin/prohibitin superfamily)
MCTVEGHPDRVTWEKFVILRAGKLRGVKGPGLFLIIPVIDRVVAVSRTSISDTSR